MIYDNLTTNSTKCILTAVRHCRKVYWYIDTLDSYIQTTKESLRTTLTTHEFPKEQLFHLTWDNEVLFIKEDE